MNLSKYNLFLKNFTKLKKSCNIKENICNIQIRNASVIQHYIDKVGPIELEDDEFRVLIIPGHTKLPERKRVERKKNKEVTPARSKSMRTDQDWSDAWPTSTTFKWSVVPFPVRQGIARSHENSGISPGKYANAELMKLPNFLHLTPVHIKKHCEQLKKFCTQFPAELNTDEACTAHFPMTAVTQSYVVDSPSIRDVRARVVTLKVKLSSLKLDGHAEDKFKRLVGNRYNEKDGTVTITTDSCPTRKQNTDYSNYILTALYMESNKTEYWESDKQLEDMESYHWHLNQSKTSTLNLIDIMRKSKSANVPAYVKDIGEDATSITSSAVVSGYATAVSELHNKGEDLVTLDNLKHASVKLLLSSTSR